jgi:hypothetical protein
VTVTTVGYGDRYPVTAPGRGVAVVLMLVGIGLIGVLTATVASYFIGKEADENIAEVTGRLERVETMVAELLARSDGQQPTADRPTVPALVAPSEHPGGRSSYPDASNSTA